MTKEPHRSRLTVRYFETDKMGFVYYSHYLVWFEFARTDYLRKKGFSYKRLEEMGYFLPVTEVFCKYISPAAFEDEIIVETLIGDLKNASMKITYRVLRETDNKLLAAGFTIHPCINKEWRIVKIPEELRNVLKQ